MLVQDAAESEQTFIMEVFSGCTRYSRVLRVVLDGFYNRDGKTILRSEQTLYLGKHLLCILYVAVVTLVPWNMCSLSEPLLTSHINNDT